MRGSAGRLARAWISSPVGAIDTRFSSFMRSKRASRPSMSSARRCEVSMPRLPSSESFSRLSWPHWPMRPSSSARKASKPWSSEKRWENSFQRKFPVACWFTCGACPRADWTMRMLPGSLSEPFGKRSISGVPEYQVFGATCLVPCQSPRAM